MKVLLASNSYKSINKEVVDYLIDTVGMPLEYIDLLKEDVVIYSVFEEEQNGIPKYIREIYKKIQSSEEKILIVSPEYNGNTTPFYLNIFDWMSRIDKNVYKDKNVKVLSVSPGHAGGANVRQMFEKSLPYFGAKNVSTFGIGNFYEVFKEGKFTDEEVEKKLQKFMK